MQLNNLQSQFRDAMLNETDASVTSNIRTNGLSTKRRLQIYRNNITAVLTGALQAIYPTIQKLVGEDFFRYTANCYLHAHSSTSGNLHNFGNYFSDFLATFPAASSLPYLPDVARLEWGYHEVFHAADAPTLNLTALSLVSAENYDRIKFTLHPASRLFSSNFPILKIWQLCANENEQDGNVDLGGGGIHLLIVRRDLEIVFEELAVAEYALLLTLSNKHPLVDACDAALKISADFDVTTCLQQHVLRGTIVDFY